LGLKKQGPELYNLLYTSSFICQGTSTRRQQIHRFDLPVMLPPATCPRHPDCLAQGHNTELACFSLHYS